MRWQVLLPLRESPYRRTQDLPQLHAERLEKFDAYLA